MEKENKTKKTDIHCACAIGDLSKINEVNAEKETEKKIHSEIQEKTDLKNEDSYNKQ